jgi:anti-sigma regulatory factor (Ser/Thr protein kinase)
MDSDDDLRILAHRDITAAALPEIRATTAELAEGAGLDVDRAARFALAVHEISVNTVDHADSTGELSVIQDDASTLIARVADHGPGLIESDPTIGPEPGAIRGRGLWLSRDMTDRMHIDSDMDGTVVHLEMVLDEPPGDAAPTR